MERKAAEKLEDPRRLYIAAGLAVGAGVVLWGAGLGILLLLGRSIAFWNALWGLAGVSFLSSVLIPIPGVTAATLLAFRDDILLSGCAIVGAAFGSTVGAAVLLGLGKTGRDRMERHATKSAWARKTLDWSTKLARKWTYAGVTLLLIPQFIPKVVVLYAAVLVKLRAVPFLVAVFIGVLLRNLLVGGAFHFLG